MTSLVRLGFRDALLGLLLILAGCGQSAPQRVLPDAPDANAATKAIELYDANHDGLLDAKELDKAPGLKAALEQIDTDHKGKISAEQIAARIKEWADSKAGRVHVICRVTHKGKPLADAKVAFVPEKFLGGAIQQGTGTTDARGVAAISSPYALDPAVKGLSPGFYRVEITKDGDKIPAKYQAETILGAEIASGIAKPDFDLQY